MTALARQAPASERCTIRLTVAAPIGQLLEWFETALPGDKAIYASGYTLPRESKAAKQAREWALKGLVDLHQTRDENDPRRFNYVIVRRDAVPPSSARQGRVEHGAVCEGARAPRPDLIREQMRFLMKRLRHYAARGEVCPSYSGLAGDLALPNNRRSRERVRTIIRRLERERHIQITPGDQQRPFVVTILSPGRARGKSTGAGDALQSRKGN